jgi:hypothetical protein
MKLFLNILAAVIVLAASVLPLSCSSPVVVDDGTYKAAIVDQLYLRQPNPDFIAEATRVLESYGFKVDVWQGADITVDFYRKLPSLGYKFIVLRVHSGLLLSMEGDKVVALPTTYLFTAENYTSTRYVTDQLADRVSNALMEEDYPLVFAVNSEFIKRAGGKFDRTVILTMGCESYKYDDLPLAFIEKGASVYVGWSDVVSLEHVDSVTLDLLHNLCTENMTLAEGISRSMADMGNDPYFGSYLKYYPSGNGNSTVWELIRQ